MKYSLFNTQSYYSLLLTSLIYFFAFPASAQSDVQWASELIGESSYFVDLSKPQSNQYKGIQVLGKPDKLPAAGESPSAWSPATKENAQGEWIKVGFAKPMKIAQVIVAENYNPGAVTHIYVYDVTDKEYLIYKNVNVGPLSVPARMFSIFANTDFLVKAVKLELNTSKVPGFNQIDAIGISSSTKEIKAEINIVSDIEIKSKVQNLGPNINSRYQEIAPMVSPDGQTIFFTRADHPQNIGNPEKQDVWYSNIKSDSIFEIAQNIGGPINTPEHNSSFSISPDGNTMLLNNIYNPDGTFEKGLSITRKNSTGKWAMPEKVVIQNYYNRNDYSEFCLSQDGKILLMTIQRNDSYGEKDIYYSRLQPDGTWSSPENLGEVVNTAASETSPFLASDGKTLYYSTSGLSGYGSNDIFVTRRLDNTWKSWSVPQNLGPEINSEKWDAYFSIPAKADYAYFASYANSLGQSDIFRIRLTEENRPDPVVLIKGRVFNAKTREPIKADILYEILPGGENAGKANSNPQTGEYKIVLPLDKKYAILAESKGFLSVDENIDLTGKTQYEEITKDLYLVPLEAGAKVRLNNIFFERTKYNLLPESFPELNRLVKTLKDNPSMEIRLEGHTEVFGKPKDQKDLGYNRVKAVKTYLVNEGDLDPKRIQLKSFGGTNPLSREITEEARALNRRVEINILKK
jgi:outer membrane protein OmpA-like peptidoglycan-associated protein